MRGDSCRYSHNTTPETTNLASLPLLTPQHVTSPTASKWASPKHFSTPAGISAKNSLSPKIVQSTQTASPSSLVIRDRGTVSAHPTQDSRAQIPCYHYARGSCRNGSTCPYSHLARIEKEIEEALDPEVCYFHTIHDVFLALYRLIHVRTTKTTIILHEISVARWPNSNVAAKCLKFPFLQISPLFE